MNAPTYRVVEHRNTLTGKYVYKLQTSSVYPTYSGRELITWCTLEEHDTEGKAIKALIALQEKDLLMEFYSRHERVCWPLQPAQGGQYP